MSTADLNGLLWNAISKVQRKESRAIEKWLRSHVRDISKASEYQLLVCAVDDGMTIYTLRRGEDFVSELEIRREFTIDESIR